MKVVVGRVSDFPAGERRVVDIERRSIGVFHVGSKFYALNNSCPHQAGPLCLGPTSVRVRSDEPGQFDSDDEPTLVTCPWHGWEYDLATGQSYLSPDEPPVRGYAVAVEAGNTLSGSGAAGHEAVPGPYVVETYSVQVDEDYVVVDTAARCRPATNDRNGGCPLP